MLVEIDGARSVCSVESINTVPSLDNAHTDNVAFESDEPPKYEDLDSISPPLYKDVVSSSV